MLTTVPLSRPPRQVLARHPGELALVEQLAAHQRDQEGRGVLGVGDDPAVGALAAVQVGGVSHLPVGRDAVSVRVWSLDRAVGIVGRVLESERFEDVLLEEHR